MLKKLIICFALAVISVMSAYARIITIEGTVMVRGKGVPAVGVYIYDQDFDKYPDGIKPIGSTDDDGFFTVKADSNGILVFYTDEDSEYDMQKYVVKVDDQFKIKTYIEPKSSGITLKEQTVVGNASPIPIDKGRLRIKGNYLMIENAVQIKKSVTKPVWNTNLEFRRKQKENYKNDLKKRKNHFKDARREIFQPVILNKTRNHIIYTAPVVVDHDEYAITQERMHDWDKSVDPLTPYQHIVPFDKDTIIIVQDSVYLEDPTDYVIQIAIRSIEDYKRVTFADTNIIREGAQNPLQFLSYKIPPLEMTDEERDKVAPNAARDSLNTEGEMNLTFPVGKAYLDPELGDNAAELAKFEKDLYELLDDPDTKLKAIRVFGYSSPEGSHQTNVKLANDRMRSAMDMIIRSIPKDRLRGVDRSSDAAVASWDEVVKMMQADSLFEEAAQIQEIIENNDNMDAQFRAISRLPFYRPLITDTYLPRLRRVTYTITAEKWRELTDDEIRQEYARDPRRLVKYNLFRLYNMLDSTEREGVLRKSVELFPYTNSTNHFVPAATDLSTVMLEKGENPFEMLSPYFDKTREDRLNDSRIPFVMKYNYAVGALMLRKFDIANSVLSRFKTEPRAAKAIAYYRVLNEDFSEDVVEEICKDNPINRVVVYLTMERNKAAWRLAQNLGDSAIENYLKAMAANRNKDDEDAMDYAPDYLAMAIKLDPSMREKAERDADVNDLLPLADNRLKEWAEEEAREAEREESLKQGLESQSNLETEE